jgi:hypothetical protein
MSVRFIVPSLVAVHEDDAEVVVGQLTGIRDKEVGRDAAPRSVELALAALDLPHHGPVLEVGIGRRCQMTDPDGAEADDISGADDDRADLVERSSLPEDEPRREDGLVAVPGLDSPLQTALADGGDEHRAGGGGARLEDARRHPHRRAPKLQRVGERNHWAR